jgi:hypothetical protein
MRGFAMNHVRRSLSLILCSAWLVAQPASATATLGGVVTALSGLGTCHDTHTVPGTTEQDTLSISAATACQGGSAGGTVHGDAVTGSIGISGYAIGSSPVPGSSQVAAQIQYMDTWLLHVPAGTAPGVITLPVVLTLEGTISAGALSGFNRYLDYNMDFRSLYGGSSPIVTMNGSVTGVGTFSRVVTGNVDFLYEGPGSGIPPTAAVGITIGYPGLNEGILDFANTASIALILPAGYTATTSSGQTLVFAVPEPATYGMLLAGLAVLVGSARRQRR